jgi:hypothetical protein
MKLDNYMDRRQSEDYANIFLCENFVCYGNKYAESMANLMQNLDPVIREKVLKIFFETRYVCVFFFSSYVENFGCYGNK